MTESEIARVCESVRRGAEMLVGRDKTGRSKLKLIRGPFGLFVERYQCSEEELATIKARLGQVPKRRLQNSSAA
jgi:hypothetical protein